MCLPLMEEIEEYPKIEVKETPKCCGSLMHKETGVQNIMPNVDDVTQYVCLKCGRYITITEGCLDSDELENFKETYLE